MNSSPGVDFIFEVIAVRYVLGESGECRGVGVRVSKVRDVVDGLPERLQGGFAVCAADWESEGVWR